jgi:heme exporter protein D
MLDLDPGKYGFFVWGAYGISLAAFAGMIWMTLARSRYWRTQAERLKSQLSE